MSSAFASEQGPQVQRSKHSRAERRRLQEKQRLERSRRAAALMADAAELYLVRHGATDWNVEGRIQGQMEPGPGLNQEGQAQASQLAEHLVGAGPFHAVYSSDLLRCRQTATAISTQLGDAAPLHFRPDLRERALGVLEGLTWSEARAREPDACVAAVRGSEDEEVPGGGESLWQVRSRIVGAVHSIAARHRGQRVVVVTHGGCLQQLYCSCMGNLYKGTVGNCSLSVAVADGREVRLTRWCEEGFLSTPSTAAHGGGARAG